MPKIETSPFFDLSSELMCIVDKNGYMLQVNTAFTRTLGYAADELTVAPLAKFIHPDDKELAQDNLTELINGFLVTHFTQRWRHRDGSYRMIAWRVSITNDLIHAVGRDVTEEHSLLDVAGYLQMIVANLPAIVFVLNSDGRFLLSAGRGLALLNLQQGEIVGESVFDLYGDEPELLDHIQRALHGETTHVISAFDDVEFENWYTPINVSGGEVEGIIGISLNVTAREQARRKVDEYQHHLEALVQKRTAALEDRERQLQAALEREKELSKFRAQFVSMASHEFRSPLSVISTSNDLLQIIDRQSGDMEKKQRHHERIHTSIRYMIDLLEDVMTVGQAQVGKLALKLDDVDISALCRRVIEEIAPPSTHPVHVEAEGRHHALVDPQMVHQILRNLIENAVKYSPEGGEILVTIYGGVYQLVLKVQDHGIGIPKVHQERLFTVFERAQNVGNITGTGLGLAIVQQAVQLHEGRIDFESEEGVGTTFTITLPRRLS